MYRGFPVGYLLFWENAQTNGAKQIGIDRKQHSPPSRLIVDGKNIDSGEFSAETREQQFAILKSAQHKVLDLTYWHQFMSALIGAGFRRRAFIGVLNAVISSVFASRLVGNV